MSNTNPETASDEQNLQDLDQFERRLNRLAKIEPAISKLAYACAEYDDLSIIDAAVETAECIAGLKKRVGTLENRLIDLEGTVAPDPNNLEFDRMKRAEKVALLRRWLIEEARRNNGKAKFSYNDVRNRFRGKASIGHAYDLMEAAAETDGFRYGKRLGGNDNKSLTVDLASVKDAVDASRAEE